MSGFELTVAIFKAGFPMNCQIHNKTVALWGDVTAIKSWEVKAV
jgi:hypothetical protein